MVCHPHRAGYLIRITSLSIALRVHTLDKCLFYEHDTTVIFFHSILSGTLLFSLIEINPNSKEVVMIGEIQRKFLSTFRYCLNMKLKPTNNLFAHFHNNFPLKKLYSSTTCTNLSEKAIATNRIKILHSVQARHTFPLKHKHTRTITDTYPIH